MLYIIIGILIFGILVATHELGHFAAAKLLGVKVNEFSVGMGPAIWQSWKETEECWESEKTLYSLRLLPIGGYCAMEGEDDDSADPRAFGKAAWWKKLVILCAGAFMNFVTGVLLIAILFAPSAGFLAPVAVGFSEEWNAQEQGLELGDRIVKVDGHAIYQVGNISLFLSRSGSDRVDLVVERDGKRVTIQDFQFYSTTDADTGAVSYYLGIASGVELNTPLTLLKYTWLEAVDMVRTVWLSLGDLLTGAVGLRDLSGPVGIVNFMTEVGSDPELSPTPEAAARNLLTLAALIAVNLAVMNLLPLPALDGGRVLFLLLNGLLYGLFRRKIDPKYEGYVHMAGLAALMCLMLVVTISDVGKLFGH